MKVQILGRLFTILVFFAVGQCCLLPVSRCLATPIQSESPQVESTQSEDGLSNPFDDAGDFDIPAISEMEEVTDAEKQAAATPKNTNPNAFAIDNDHTSIVFAVSHYGISYTYGRFNKCSGAFEMINGEPGQGGFDFVIESKSVDTNSIERDDHLRGPDFFDVEQFPQINFKTTAFQKVGSEYRVKGDLKMLGETRPVELSIRMVGAGKGPFGNDRVGFFTKFTIKRSDFGMETMLGSIGDKISITFSFEGKRVPLN